MIFNLIYLHSLVKLIKIISFISQAEVPNPHVYGLEKVPGVQVRFYG